MPPRSFGLAYFSHAILTSATSDASASQQALYLCGQDIPLSLPS
jgi:hypothetical protein